MHVSIFEGLSLAQCYAERLALACGKGLALQATASPLVKICLEVAAFPPGYSVLVSRFAGIEDFLSSAVGV
jgi:hypothetical protein